MSIEAPKRIYTGSVAMLSEEQLNHPDTKAFATVRRKYEDDIEYIRADIVDELVEALEDIRDYEFSHRYIKDITRAALVKAKEELRMSKRHIHADVIHAWAEGEEIEYLSDSGEWQLVTWTPYFVEPNEWRIKPKLVKKEGWVLKYCRGVIGEYHVCEKIFETEDEARKACPSIIDGTFHRIEWEEKE